MENTARRSLERSRRSVADEEHTVLERRDDEERSHPSEGSPCVMLITDETRCARDLRGASRSEKTSRAESAVDDSSLGEFLARGFSARGILGNEGALELVTSGILATSGNSVARGPECGGVDRSLSGAPESKRDSRSREQRSPDFGVRLSVGPSKGESNHNTNPCDSGPRGPIPRNREARAEPVTRTTAIFRSRDDSDRRDGGP